MTSLLARIRSASPRHHGLRLLWVLTVFGLLFGGVPRWEIHQHDVAAHEHEHDHHHPVMAVDQQAASAQTDDTDDSAAVVTHLHAAPVLSIAMIDAAMPLFGRPMLTVPAFATADLSAPAQHWPPPDRPPIA